MAIRVERDVAITMRDGVRLLADVYTPETTGPFPTLLYRVRGSKSSSFIAGAILLNPIVAADRGFAVCIQEVRGRGSSEGEWHPFVHEGDDGTDTLDWLGDQPWCNGRIGAYGTAYTGIDALLLAATGHPSLEAVVAVVSGVSPHNGWIYTNGAFELGWNNFWAYLTAGDSLKRLDISAVERDQLAESLQMAMERPRDQMERLPLIDQPTLEAVSPQYKTWLEHSSYDEYWKALDVTARADQITAKVLSITGWWDNFLGSHLALYRALKERSPSGRHQRLVIGPWDHFTYVGVVPTTAGVRNFGPAGGAGPVVTESLALDWFGRWLRDEVESESTAAGTRWFAVGGGGWRNTDSWPPPGVQLRMHLHEGGSLSIDPPGEQAPDQYDYDPRDPTPTVGGRTLMPTVGTAGVQDQQTVATRTDVLIYDCEPLDTSLEIAGNVSVDLWAASSAVDTDFAAVLVDVAPDGARWLVADGIIRARHRHGFHRQDYLTPGEPTRFGLDLWDVAWTFAVGHRVGLHLSSASFPRFDRNLNVAISTGRGSLEDAAVADQQVFHDAAHPSALVLHRISTDDQVADH